MCDVEEREEEDWEKKKLAFGYGSWQLFGGSWLALFTSSLVLAYGLPDPHHQSELIMMGIRASTRRLGPGREQKGVWLC
jgi:hypothetical protein